MILYFNPNFNNLDDSFQEKYDSFILNNLKSFKCPNELCSHSSQLLISTSYERYVFYDVDKFFILTVYVVLCPECGTYHVILPSFLMPFSSYTYPFIIRTLYAFFFGPDKGNKSRVCSSMCISRKVLERFISIYSMEEVRAARRGFDSSRLKDIIRNHTNTLFHFLIEYFSSSDRIIFLLPHIHRHFHVSFFYPLE